MIWKHLPAHARRISKDGNDGFAHRLGNALALPALKLASQQVAKPPFQQWHNTTQEEQPDTPHRSPEAHPWSLAYWPSVEAVVHQML